MWQYRATSSNQIFVMAIETSTYRNHRDSVAIAGPSITMLLMRGNKVYCNPHCRCWCTYYHSLTMWQQVSLATPGVLQSYYCNTHGGCLYYGLQHYMVFQQHYYVAIGKNLLQHQNESLGKPFAMVNMATPANEKKVLQFCLSQPFLVYCNAFRPLHQG